jgi:3' exoribonuclease, RNase T-like
MNQFPQIEATHPFRWKSGCIDLETLSTAADAVVLEIGCVLFDVETNTLGPEYHAEVEMRAPDQRLRSVDGSTFSWWARRLADGHDMPGMHGGVSLWQALQGLTAFLKEHEISAESGTEMWAWGSDFDFSILKDAYSDAQLPLPWNYGKQCDARSVCKKLEVNREGGVKHMALEDARQEAQAVMTALRKLSAFMAKPFTASNLDSTAA